MHRSIALSMVVMLGVVGAGSAAADLGKLDPRARVALARLRSGAPTEGQRAAGAAIHGAGELDVFIVGAVSRAALEAAGARVRSHAGGVFTAWVPAGAIEAVAALPDVRRIEGSAPVYPQLDASIPETNAHHARGPGPAFAGVNGQGVIVGVVDTGVDYDHGDFDDETGRTRLIGLWDQTDSVGTTPLAIGTAPYDYGSDWPPTAIDAGFATERDLINHGTHVLGIAAGDGSGTGGAIPPFTYVGVAPKADLVVVKTDFTRTGVVDGVSYVFQRAAARGQNAVVNLSLGSQFGPHDGTSAFESGLSALTGPGRVVVAAAGNDRGRQYHAEVLAAGSGTDAALFVAGSLPDRTIAIDGYYESSEDVSLQIRTPDGTVIGPLPRGTLNVAFPGQSTISGSVYVENGVSTSLGGDPEVYIEINTDLPGQNMNGVWTFTFIPVALGPANGEVDLWRFFAGQNVYAAFTFGNQVEELIVEPGNADSLVTVAAYLTKSRWTDCGGRTVVFDPEPPFGSLAGFSSPGPTRTGARKPDLAAPGIGIASSTSFDLPQPCPTTDSELLDDDRRHFIDAGTSMSAPHVAGVVALLEQKLGAVTPSFVKAYLATHAVTDAFTGPVWNRDWGAGKLWVGDLTDPTAQVVFPNAGTDTLNIGSIRDLTWTAADPYQGVVAVDLFLSRDGGADFEAVALGIPNSGSCAWTVSGPATSQARLKVVAHDAGGNQGQDLSDQDWVIGGGVTGIEPLAGAATEFALAAGPNPSSGAVTVEFSIARGADVRVTVQDLQGREVAELARGRFAPGRYRTTWGASEPRSGIYWVRLRARGIDRVRRIALTR